MNSAPATSMQPSRRPLAALLLALAASGALASCAGRKGLRPQPGADDPGLSARAPSDLAARPVETAQNGLEAASWIVSSSDEDISRVLAPYLPRPLPMDPAVAALWEANGVRIVSIPMDQLDLVQHELATVGAVQRQWLGEATTWTDCLTGPPWTGTRTLALDSGRLALGPGRLRLLTRCWTIPVPVAPSEPDQAPAAVLHIELLIQHKEDAVNRPALSMAPLDTTDALGAGLVFRRLLAELTVTEGSALVLLPYKPGAPWGGGDDVPSDHATTDPEPARDATSTAHADQQHAATDPRAPLADGDEVLPGLGEVVRHPGSRDSATPGTPGDPSGVGPPEAAVMTIGELLMTRGGVRPPTRSNPNPTSRAPWRAEQPSRAMLVLIPRVPDRFRLIE